MRIHNKLTAQDMGINPLTIHSQKSDREKFLNKLKKLVENSNSSVIQPIDERAQSDHEHPQQQESQENPQDRRSPEGKAPQSGSHGIDVRI